MRALRLLVAAACAVVPATVAPARAEVVPSCPYASSTKVLYAQTVTGDPVSVLVHQPNATDTYLCVDTPVTGWVVVLHDSVSVQGPVHSTTAEGECAVHVFYEQAQRISVGVGADRSLCVGINGYATTYTVGGPVGESGTADVEVWRSGGRVTDNAFCLNEWIVYQTSPWAPDDYTPCYYGMHRVL